MRFIASALLILAAAAPAQAYIGPGAGLGAIGTAIALFGAVLLLAIGFVWYPVKRWRRKREEARRAATERR